MYIMQNYFQSIPISIVLRIYNIFAEDLHVLMHHLTSKQKSSVTYANFLFFSVQNICTHHQAKLVLLWAQLTKIYPPLPHLSNLFP
jgi:hypothetical protein